MSNVKIISFIRKVFVVFAGILTILMLLEVSLRIIGYFHLKKSDKSIELSKKDNTILCLGDSFTAGLGAAKGKGYPEQLEDMLNQGNSKKFCVINRGISNENTSRILKRLPKELNDFKFSMVIILAGGANQWNFWGYHKNSVNNIFYNFKVFKLITLLYNNVAGLHSSDVKRENNGYSDAVESENSLNKFKEHVGNVPSNSDNYYNIGVYYLYEMKDYREAAKWFKSGIKINPDDRKNYSALRSSVDYFGNQKEFIQFIYDKIRENPLNVNLWYILGTFNPAIIDKVQVRILFDLYINSLTGKDKKTTIFSYPLIIYAYNLLSDKEKCINLVKEELIKDKNNLIINYINGFVNEKQGKSPEADKYYEKSILLFNNMIKSNRQESQKYYKLIYDNFYEHDNIFIKFAVEIPEYKYFFNSNNVTNLSGNSNLVSQWIKSDLYEIINFFKAQGIKVIIMNYPLHFPFAPEYFTNKVIYDIVRENPELDFIDNSYRFDFLKDVKDNYFEKYGSHPNEKGYELIAKSIYDKIITGNLIK